MVHDAVSLAQVVGFLVAILVLGRACANEGLFESLASKVDFLARGQKFRLYAPVRLSNSASMLLPVSNLTNVLAFGATGLTFVGFAWAMLPVWVVAIVAEYAVLRWWFRDEVRTPPEPSPTVAIPVPLFPAAVVIVVLLGMAGGATPVIPATAGAILLGGYALLRHSTTWQDLFEAARLPLAAFVFVWALAVSFLGSTLVGEWFDDALPSGIGLASLFGIALFAMIAAGLINNLPATLLLLPAAAAAGPEAVLALLIGVNLGANLTIIGSLGNLLWRQSHVGEQSSLRVFHSLGFATTPFIVVLCTVVLWAWTSLIW